MKTLIVESIREEPECYSARLFSYFVYLVELALNKVCFYHDYQATNQLFVNARMPLFKFDTIYCLKKINVKF